MQIPETFNLLVIEAAAFPHLVEFLVRFLNKEIRNDLFEHYEGVFVFQKRHQVEDFALCAVLIECFFHIIYLLLTTQI
jgi:hypothetical protein